RGRPTDRPGDRRRPVPRRGPVRVEETGTRGASPPRPPRRSRRRGGPAGRPAPGLSRSPKTRAQTGPGGSARASTDTGTASEGPESPPGDSGPPPAPREGVTVLALFSGAAPPFGTKKKESGDPRRTPNPPTARTDFCGGKKVFAIQRSSRSATKSSVREPG